VAGAIGHSSAAASMLPQAPGRPVEDAARVGAASRAAPESAGNAWSEARAVAQQGAGPSLGSPAGPSRRLVVQLTAYSASVEEGTAWGITRVGTRVRPGVVAVDPAVIPLGSRLRIEGLAGTYRAEDTGGGIRGAHIDIFMESRSAALQFGRRSAVVAEVLD
jgi:3D (Asp-Asp-Asp) domain-containing protein